MVVGGTDTKSNEYPSPHTLLIHRSDVGDKRSSLPTNPNSAACRSAVASETALFWHPPASIALSSFHCNRQEACISLGDTCGDRSSAFQAETFLTDWTPPLDNYTNKATQQIRCNTISVVQYYDVAHKIWDYSPGRAHSFCPK